MTDIAEHKEPKFDIPAELYKEATRVFPIAAADSVIRYQGGVLLGKRYRDPAKGRYWTFGGRIKHGEVPEDAIVRIVEQETGLKSRIEKSIGTYSQWFDHGQFGYPTYYIVLTYLMTPESESAEVKLDFQHSNYYVVRDVDSEILSEYCRQVIIDSGIFGEHPDKDKRRNFRDK